MMLIVRLLLRLVSFLRPVRRIPAVSSVLPMIGHPYRDSQKQSLKCAIDELPQRGKSVVEQYTHLFDSAEEDALWLEWCEVYRTESPNRLAFDDTARDGLRARSLRSILESSNPDIYFEISKVAKLPVMLREFAFDFALERVMRVADGAFNSILGGIAATGERQARRAIDLIDASESHGRYVLTSLIRDQDVDLALRRRADEKMRTAVIVDTSERHEIAREYFDALGCRCRYENGVCDTTLLREQVEFLVEIGSTTFCSYSTFTMIRSHFNGITDEALRLQILRLYVKPLKEPLFRKNDFDPAWIMEALTARDTDLVNTFRDGIARGEARRQENEDRQKIFDVKVATLKERVRRK